MLGKKGANGFLGISPFLVLLVTEYSNCYEFSFCSEDNNGFLFSSKACPGGVLLKNSITIKESCFCIGEVPGLNVYENCPHGGVGFNGSDAALRNPSLSCDIDMNSRIEYGYRTKGVHLLFPVEYDGLGPQNDAEACSSVNLPCIIPEENQMLGGVAQDSYSLEDSQDYGRDADYANFIEDSSSTTFDNDNDNFKVDHQKGRKVRSKRSLRDFGIDEDDVEFDVEEGQRDRRFSSYKVLLHNDESSEERSIPLNKRNPPQADETQAPVEPGTQPEPETDSVTDGIPSAEAEGQISTGGSSGSGDNTYQELLATIKMMDKAEQFRQENEDLDEQEKDPYKRSQSNKKPFKPSEFGSTMAVGTRAQTKIQRLTKLISKAFMSLAKGIIPDEIIEKVSQIFIMTFMDLGYEAYFALGDSLNFEVYRLVKEMVHQCSWRMATRVYKFDELGTCPKKLGVYNDWKTKERIPNVASRMPEEYRYKAASEDFVLGFMWKMIDAVHAECYDLWVERSGLVPMAFISFFEGAFWDCRMNKQFYSSVNSPRLSYEKVLLEGNMPFEEVMERMDMLTAAIHLRSKVAGYFHKPEIVSCPTPYGSGAEAIVPLTSPPLTRRKRNAVGSLKELEIWGGKAYCLQKLDPSLPPGITNSIPNIGQICNDLS